MSFIQRASYPEWDWYYPTPNLRFNGGLLEQFWKRHRMPKNLPPEEWVDAVTHGKMWIETCWIPELCTEQHGEWRRVGEVK